MATTTWLRDYDVSLSSSPSTTSTSTASADMLIVEITYSRSTTSITNVTFNGVALTKQISKLQGQNGTEIWTMAYPPQGTYNLVITYSASAGSINANISVWQNGSQIRAVGSAGAAGSGDLTVSLATQTSDDKMIAVGSAESAAPSDLTGNTSMYNGYVTSEQGYRMSYKNGAVGGSVIGFNTANTDLSICAIAIGDILGALFACPGIIG